MTKRLQTRGFTLAAYRDDIDVLLKAIEKETSKPGSRLYGCSLGHNYLRINIYLKKNHFFESGVMKIQRKKENELSHRDKTAVKSLLMSNPGGVQESDGSDEDITMTQRLNKRSKTDENDRYVPIDFILGFYAEVERLWSTVKYVIT